MQACTTSTSSTSSTSSTTKEPSSDSSSSSSISTSTSNHHVLRSATAVHARSLAALNRPIEARSYFRLLSRFNINDGDAASAVDADIAQVELHICTSSLLPVHLCNVSAVSHHVREDILRKERKRRMRRKKLTSSAATATTSRTTDWGSIFRRESGTDDRDGRRTHIVPLRQKIRHDLLQVRHLLRLQRRQTSKFPPPTSDERACLNCDLQLEQQQLEKMERMYIMLHKVLQRNYDRASKQNIRVRWKEVDVDISQSLSAEEKNQVAISYGSVVHLPRTEWNSRTSVLSSTFLRSTKSLESLYRKQGWVVADDVLNTNAMESIQRYLNTATIWNDPRMGYIGAYGNTGVLFDTTVMFAKEIGRLMPLTIHGRPLVQMWCYKYDSNYNRPNNTLENSGISVHADDAIINLNIWLTKTTRSEKKEQAGGLIIYPGLKSDKKDSFHEFNQSPSRVNVKNAQQVKILHKTNRMVMFDSSMYHQSDAGMNFGHKYEESRINLTLLYGRRNTEF
jgi:hypothetical protein